MLVTNLVFFRKTPFGPTTLTKVWVWFWVLNSFHHLISLKTCKNIWDVFISHLFKNVFAHVSIYCWERVVEEVKVLVGVHSPKTNNQVLYKATSSETPCIWQPSSSCWCNMSMTNTSMTKRDCTSLLSWSSWPTILCFCSPLRFNSFLPLKQQTQN